MNLKATQESATHFHLCDYPHITDAITKKVPAHMHGALVRYLNDGIQPGDFLTKLLQGKLEAFFIADEINLSAFRDWVDFLYNDMPSVAWGSETIVGMWTHSQREVRDDRG